MPRRDALSPAGVAAARGLATALPDLLIEARRVAASVTVGWHGRRKAGLGEDFWQFRPFQSGETMRGIDWRRSARDDTLYVRERELENAHTVWIWVDLSASMTFRSDRAPTTKRDRAILLAIAFAELLARAGERVGLLGDPEPTARRDGAEVIALKLARIGAVNPETARLAVRRFHDVVLLSDFLDDAIGRDRLLTALAGTESRVHLVEIVDPAEDSFPYAGRIEFVDPENGARLLAGRAEAWRDDYLRRRADHRASLERAASRAGWSHHLHHTDQPAVEVLIDLASRLVAGATGEEAP